MSIIRRLAPLALLAVTSTPFAAAQTADTLFHGSYAVTQFFDDAVDGTSAAVSSMVPDGQGGGTFEVLAHSANDLGSGPLVYAVDADRAFTITADEVTIYGILRPDGEGLTMTELDAEAFGIYVGLKTASGLTTADLSGDYAAVQYFDDSDDGPSAGFLRVRFDASGEAIFETVAHSNGDLTTDTLTHALSDDGTFSGQTQNSLPIRGVFNPVVDGFTAAALHRWTFGLYAGVRTSSGQTDALLDGRYVVTRYLSDGGIARSAYATVTLDGAGAGRLETLQTSMSETDVDTFAYAVADDGTFEWLNDRPNRGAASADGAWFVWTELDPAEFGVMIGIRQSDRTTAVDPNPSEAPSHTLLAYPNPASHETHLAYSLPDAAHVHIAVYDALGRRVAVIVDGWQSPGTHTVTWTPTSLGAGVYVYRLSTDARVQRTRTFVIR